MAAGRSRWTEARRDGPTARGQPDRAPRTGGPRKAHATWSIGSEQTRGHLCTVRDTRTGSRDEDLPDARANGCWTPEGPSTVHARPEHAPALAPRGSRTVRVGIGLGRPEGLREQRGAEALRRPTRDLGSRREVGPDQRPARPEVNAAPPSSPTGPPLLDPGSSVSPPNPRDRAQECLRAAPCVATGSADRGTALDHRACPRGGPRSGHGQGRDPPADTPRARASQTGPCFRRCSSARRLAKPNIRSSEPIAPTSPPTRPAPRIRASSPSPNHCQQVRSRRVGASSDPTAVGTGRSPRSPSEPSRARSPRPVPGRPRHGVATVRLHDIGQDPGLVVHRAGEPWRRTARPRERCSARYVPDRGETMSPSPRTLPDAVDPGTHGDQHRLACANRMLREPSAPTSCRHADRGRARDTAPRRTASRSPWTSQVWHPGVTSMSPSRRHARRERRSCTTTTAGWRGGSGDVARADPRSALRRPRPLESAGWEPERVLSAPRSTLVAANSRRARRAVHQRAAAWSSPHEMAGGRNRRRSRTATRGQVPVCHRGVDPLRPRPETTAPQQHPDGCPFAAAESTLPGR